MTIQEFEQLWVESGRNLKDLKLNRYKIYEEDGYVTGFAATLDDEYDFYGQMALFPEATEGWMKFIRDESETRGTFVVDEDKKAEIIAEREAEAKKPTAMDILEAQMMWTALNTDTMLPEEE